MDILIYQQINPVYKVHLNFLKLHQINNIYLVHLDCLKNHQVRLHFPKRRGPRSIHSTQPHQTPVTMQRPTRKMPPRDHGAPQLRTPGAPQLRTPGAPQLRAPRPHGQRTVVSNERPSVPKLNPMAGVRILLKFPTCIKYLYAVFFSRCNKLKKDLEI